MNKNKLITNEEYLQFTELFTNGELTEVYDMFLNIVTGLVNSLDQ
jgi:hypothetical protein